LERRDLRDPATVLGGVLGENRWRLARAYVDRSDSCEHPGMSDSSGVVKAFSTLGRRRKKRDND
jgi:hypothetical protein